MGAKMITPSRLMKIQMMNDKEIARSGIKALIQMYLTSAIVRVVTKIATLNGRALMPAELMRVSSRTITEIPRMGLTFMTTRFTIMGVRIGKGSIRTDSLTCMPSRLPKVSQRILAPIDVHADEHEDRQGDH